MAQLVAYVVKLIFTIVGLAETARRNKLECKELARRVSVIGEVLQRLKQQEPWVAAPLAGLRDALLEAHGLVDGCCQKSQRKRDRVRALVGADRHAERFREVNCRIDRQLNLIPLLSHISIVSRLEEITTSQQAQLLLPLPPKQKQTIAGSGGSKPTGTVASSSDDDDGVVKKLTWAEITAATDNWAAVVGVGRGSSSTVYRGRMPPAPDGRDVAVKRLGKHGRRGMDDAFVAEFEVLCSVRHDHVVRLVGWCADAGERRAFVYDHASNGTLRDHLRGGAGASSPVSATWRARLEALLGPARALDHLHRRGVIHRDVSSSSILLDARWAPRLAGFGAAVFRACTAGHERQAVSEVVGAHGYLDPEYLSTGLVGPASDVYSYGVVMLEALTGRPPVEATGGSSSGWDSDPVTLVESALDDHGKLRVDVLDARPAPEKKMTEALELVAYTAERCLWPTAEVRPDMSGVVANLEKALGMMTPR